MNRERYRLRLCPTAPAKALYNAVLYNLYKSEKNFKHEVSKPDVVQPCINLTFRRIERE
jgi:hypothetical protein